MQAVFRFTPAIIYIIALLAIILSIPVIRPTKAIGFADFHCQNAKYSDCQLVRSE